MTLEQSEGSAQLRRFRQAIAAGRSLADAVEIAGAGFTIDEGRATLAEDAKRPPNAKATQTKDIDDMAGKKIAGKMVDPLGDLSKGLAADHALEKAKEAPAAKLDPAAIFKAPDPVNKAETALTASAPIEAESDRESDDAGFSKQLDKVVDQVLNAEFESGTLVGDMVDAMLVAIRQNPKGWSHMDEKQQRDTIRNLEKVAQKLLRKIAIVVAEGDRPSIHATLVDYSAKDGFSIKLKCNADEATALMLYKLQKHEVIVTTVDTTANNGRRKEPHVDLDQAEISFADPAPKADAKPPKPKPTPPADDSDLAGEVEETKPDTSVEQDDAAAAALAPEVNPLETDRIFNAMFAEWLAKDGATWTDDEEAAGVWEAEKADELAESLLSAEVPALHIYAIGHTPEAGDVPDFQIQPPKPEAVPENADAFEEDAEEVSKRNATVTGKEPAPDAADAWMKGLDD